MRAAFIDGKEQLAVRETETPTPGDGEVRLRIGYVGICGSDLHYYFEGANGEYVVREPLVPGHELSGWIDLDPSGTWEQGTPVTVHPARFGTPEEGIEDEPHLWPGGSYLGSASTWPHTQGAMSEYLIVREDMVRVLPGDLPVRRAVLAEPLGVALHAATRAGDLAGTRVLVSGAGPIGLLAAAAAKARGASQVTVSDVLEAPLERAKAIGADQTVRIGEEDLPQNAFDVVFECSGAPVAISSAGQAVRRRGTVVQVGMVPNEPRPVNLAPFISKEVALLGTFRFRDEVDEAVALLASRPEIEDVVTHELPLEEVVAAFDTARDSRISGKVVVTLPGAAD
jgi:L-idonate 5-dehydrogenase